MVFMRTALLLEKYSGLDYANLFPVGELASLEAEIVSSLPRFFEASNSEGVSVQVSDLDWRVARVEDAGDGLVSTLYCVSAFGMRDFFTVDELMEEDAEGNMMVFLSAHLV